MYRNLQIHLLTHYQLQNYELNTLFYQFHMRAKILFTTESVTNEFDNCSKQRLNDTMFNLTEAITILQAQHNWEALGSSFMVLGYLFAAQTKVVTSESRRSLIEAMMFMDEAVQVQKLLIKNQKERLKAELNEGHSNVALDRSELEEIQESQIILAYRYYSHGVAAANYFFLREESKHDKKIQESNWEQNDNIRKEIKRTRLSNTKRM